MGSFRMRVVTTVVILLCCVVGYGRVQAGQTALRYISLGCWRDGVFAAIPPLEGKGDPILDGPYRRRVNVTEKCALAASKRGYSVFALRNGGYCMSSPTAYVTYQKYGKSTACTPDGKGGLSAIQVYQLEIPVNNQTYNLTVMEGNTRSVSCPPGQVIQVIKAYYGYYNITKSGISTTIVLCNAAGSSEKITSKCDGNNSCNLTAANSVFGNSCPVVDKKYIFMDYRCIVEVTKLLVLLQPSLAGYDCVTVLAKLAASSFQINKTITVTLRWTASAWTKSCATCHSLVSNQTYNLIVMEGNTSFVSCPRRQVIYVITAYYGYENITIFSSHTSLVICHAAGSSKKITSKCDGSNSCNLTAANSVFGNSCPPRDKKYIFMDYRCALQGRTSFLYKSLGCWKDTKNRSIPSLEGDPFLGTNSYRTRTNAIEKCTRAAYQKGYMIFAVQDGGWCASSATANATYQMYGASTACKADGKGGPWANQVYQFEISVPPTTAKTTAAGQVGTLPVKSTIASTTTATTVSKPLQGYTIFNQSSETLRPTGEVTIRFPSAFNIVPALITVNLTYSGNYSYHINVAGKYMWGFTANISRIDSMPGFAVEIWIHWTAYLAKQACTGMVASNICSKAYQTAQKSFLTAFKTSPAAVRNASRALRKLTEAGLNKKQIEEITSTFTSTASVISSQTTKVEVAVLSDILLMTSNIIQAMMPTPNQTQINIAATKTNDLVKSLTTFAKNIQASSLVANNNSVTVDQPQLMLKVVRPIRNVTYSNLMFKTSSYSNQNSSYKPTTLTVRGNLLDTIFPVKRKKRAATNSTSTTTTNVQFLLFRGSVLFPGLNAPMEVITVQPSSPVTGKLSFSLVFGYPNPCSAYQKPSNQSLKICLPSPKCVNWNGTGWATTSCWLGSINPTKIECMCDSFGSFGMTAWTQVDLANFNLPSESKVACVLTAIFLIVVFLLFMLNRPLRQRKPSLPIRCTFLCLALSNIVFAGGVEQVTYSAACSLITFLWHWFFLCTFSWMFITAGSLKHFAEHKKDSKSKLRVVFEILLGFVLPLLIVLINILSAASTADKSSTQRPYVFESEYRERHACFLREFSLIIGLMLPAGIFLVLTIILLILTRISLKDKEEFEEEARPLLKSVDHVWLIWVFLTILTSLAWIFVPSMVNSDNTSSKSTFSWIFAIINIIEGILILYLTCLHRKIDRENIRRCCCCEITEAEVFPLTTPHKDVESNDEDDNTRDKKDKDANASPENEYTRAEDVGDNPSEGDGNAPPKNIEQKPPEGDGNNPAEGDEK